MKLNVPVLVLSAGMAAVLSTLATVAIAEPLSLTLSQSIAHDSNFSRTTAPRGDWISQTDATVKLDKPYGRQNYSGSARIGTTRFKENADKLNNQNYDLAAGFSTGIASNWQVNTSVSASENLNPSQNNSVDARLEKNVISQRAGAMDVQYGVQGRWAMIGSLSTSRLSYSLANQKYQNRKQGSQGLRLTYATSDLLVFGIGGTHTQSDFDDRAEPEQVVQNSVDLTANWQVTGYSNLNAMISSVENSYRTQPDLKIKTVTGRMNWRFTPRGLTTYALTLARTTDSDPAKTDTVVGSLDRSQDTVTTSLLGSLRWSATSKLGFGAALGWYQYDVQRADLGTGIFQTNVQNGKSSYRTLTLSSDYQYSRALGFGCNVQRYKQSADQLTRIAFDGTYYSCRASFTID